MKQKKNWWGAGLYYDNALNLFQLEPNGNEMNIATCHHKIAQVYYNMEHVLKAEQFFLAALPAMEQAGKYDRSGDICEALGAIYLCQNDSEKAVHAYKTANQNYMASTGQQPDERTRRIDNALRSLRQANKLAKMQDFRSNFVRESMAYNENEQSIQYDESNNDELENEVENSSMHYLDPSVTKRKPQVVVVADAPPERQKLEQANQKLGYSKFATQAKFNLTEEAHPRPLDTVSPLKKLPFSKK